jgi:hypothetical protein
LSGEREFSSSVTLRTGLDFFYGWVKEDYKFAFAESFAPLSKYTEETSLDGHQWGINASLGSTFRLQRFSIEPFLGGGYQKTDLKGDGYETRTPADLDMDKSKQEWLVGGGLSILF